MLEGKFKFHLAFRGGFIPVKAQPCISQP
jgi:hypothetical protein